MREPIEVLPYFEITDEMLSAGSEALRHSLLGEELRDVAERVYIAMHIENLYAKCEMLDQQALQER